MRHLRFVPVTPDEVFAGRPALIGIRIGNRKRWRASYSLTVEAGGASAWVPRLPPGADQLVSWEAAFATRGRQPFPQLRIATRFPFGLFVKAGTLAVDAEVVVFPAVRAIEPEARRQLAAGGASVRRRGRGVDLYNLREYRPGDEPRLVHWRSSAKTGALVVRELEADTAADTRIVLGRAGEDSERVEAGLSDAASLAVHLLRAGGAVELCGPGVHVPPGRGREHRQRILTALALFDAKEAARASAVRRSPRRMREIPVALG